MVATIYLLRMMTIRSTELFEENHKRKREVKIWLFLIFGVSRAQKVALYLKYCTEAKIHYYTCSKTNVYYNTTDDESAKMTQSNINNPIQQNVEFKFEEKKITQINQLTYVLSSSVSSFL